MKRIPETADVYECTECGTLSMNDGPCLNCTALAAISEDVRALNAMHLSVKARPFADAVTHDATKVLR